MLNKSDNLQCLQKYIIKTIVQFFSNSTEIVTSRYVLYFDSKESIIKFDLELRQYISNLTEVNILKAKLGNSNIEVEILPNYIFYNDEGTVEYEATRLKISNGITERILVFIPDYDMDGILLGDAFKNRIRNEFIDVKEDKILFYLSVQNIASVSKTTENFQRQGMPLSVSCVYDYLYTQVSLIQGTNQQKILRYSLNKIKSNKLQNDNSLLEFAPIIRIIEAQKLCQDDFQDLHMFPMSLTDLGKNDCNLDNNYRLYRKVSLALEDHELEAVMSSYETGIIKQLQKNYEMDENNWDKKFTFEGIEKYKKVNTKKFKLEQPIIILDSEDNELAKAYYWDSIKANAASFIIFTKEISDEKIFKIYIRFTRKANIEGTSDLIVESTNNRGNAYMILLNKADDFYHGKVKFVNGKKSEFTIYVSVMNVPAAFLTDACIGMREEKNECIYQFKTQDYEFICRHKMVIEKLNYYEWARFLEKVNEERVAVKLLDKIDGSAKRSNLAMYRQILYEEFENKKCFYCGKQLNSDRMEVDHFIPWSFIKDDNLWNLVLSCPVCNRKKNDKLPAEDFITMLIKRNNCITIEKYKFEMKNYQDKMVRYIYNWAKINGYNKIWRP